MIPSPTKYKQTNTTPAIKISKASQEDGCFRFPVISNEAI